MTHPTVAKVITNGSTKWCALCPVCHQLTPMVCDKRTALQAVDACDHQPHPDPQPASRGL